MFLFLFIQWVDITKTPKKAGSLVGWLAGSLFFQYTRNASFITNIKSDQLAVPT